jgi:hypothetical protein
MCTCGDLQVQRLTEKVQILKGAIAYAKLPEPWPLAKGFLQKGGDVCSGSRVTIFRALLSSQTYGSRLSSSAAGTNEICHPD